MTRTLAHSIIEGARGVDRTAYVLHGILGSSKNWRSSARRWARAFPDWRFVLVDLRGHGGSTGMAGPHTLEACAADLDTLEGLTGAAEAIIGHSFGGKVALSWARRRAARPRDTLRHVWSLDSPPGVVTVPAREVSQVLRMLESLPDGVASREALLQETRRRGLPDGIGHWLSTSLTRVDAGFGWSFELSVVQTLLEDYYPTDLWPYVSDHPGAVNVHLIRAGGTGR